MRPLALRPEVASFMREAPSFAHAERFLRSALDEPSRGERLRVATFTAPVGRATALLGLLGEARGVLYAAPGEPSYAGLGAAWEMKLEGAARFDVLRAASAGLFAELRELREPGAPLAGPVRLFGGLSFIASGDHGDAWAGFGDGLFVLPRWTYVAQGDHATLSLAIPAGSEHSERALAELRPIWDALADGASPGEEGPRTTAVEHLGLGAWEAQVEAIRDAISEARFQKVVAARRAVVALDHAVSPRRVLDRLAGRFPGCTSFAMLRDGAAFVGATPEKLVERRGAVVATEALAGSIARGRGADLLSSPKDREEHELVIDAIVEGLRPFCTQLSLGAEPRIRELPNVLHMQTPIEGRLREGVHVLELVEALHPTPAVGGVPTADAMRWIAAREEAPRGWYSAPFGWLDASGDGAFVVALRSGVLRGDHVYVYAGAGIVRGSEPAAEYEETALKMQALLGALDERAARGAASDDVNDDDGDEDARP
jgi:isochorismate synthase